MSDWNEAIETIKAAINHPDARMGWSDHELIDLLDSLKRPSDQEGWKLVPVEPTEEMYQAALQSGFEGSLDNFSADFKSACSAAPTPEAK